MSKAKRPKHDRKVIKADCPACNPHAAGHVLCDEHATAGNDIPICPGCGQPEVDGMCYCDDEPADDE